MSVKRATPAFDRLTLMTQELAKGRSVIEVKGLTGPSATKLAVLDATGRPVFEVTPQLVAAALRYGKAEIHRALSSGDLRTAKLRDALARGVRNHILLRITSGTGNDVPFKRLSRAYVAWKAQRGLDPRIGIARGVLLRNLLRATWAVRPSR